MKKMVFIFVILISYGSLTGQYQLFNKDFEEWVEMPVTGNPTYAYYTPWGEIWATSNEASMVFLAKPSVSRTTDKYNGTYAAKIETVQLGTSKGSGTIFTGKFKVDVANPLNSTKFGIPFTDKPISFRGFYKFIPVANDSFDIETYLTKWDNVAKKRDTVAAAVISREQSILAKSSYTEFNLFYTYYLQESPDSLSIIMASSADGSNFNAAIGTTLIVDAISLEYYPLNVETSVKQREILVYPNPIEEIVTIESKEFTAREMKVYNSVGSLLLYKQLNSSKENISTYALPSGIYYYTVSKKDGTTESGKLFKK